MLFHNIYIYLILLLFIKQYQQKRSLLLSFRHYPFVWIKTVRDIFSLITLSSFLLSRSQRSSWSCCRYLEQSETFFTSLTFKVSEHMGQTDSVSKSLKQNTYKYRKSMDVSVTR